jgi:lipopolysaccharide transport system ATP-binding protein
MNNKVIKVEGLSKKYLIGHEKQESYSSLRDVVSNNAKQIGKSIKKVFSGSETGHISGDIIEEFWALKNLNFEINQGEVIGVIGRNGAGKSTLLKVLSRITEPTQGRIEINGRMASLLEVGTGFHPELTGRENIYLNGAILGMSRFEVKRKFDEIVNFSGVEKFLDTPVKRYSSGMYVRLAFAVAAHLETEILVVDEVLAVGDAEFQKKCLGKMNDISKGEGRTVLFVSHNMGAVNDLCSSVLFLKNGSLYKSGNTSDLISEYFKVGISIDTNAFINDYKSRRGNGEIRFEEVSINNNSAEIDPNKEIEISFKIKGIEGVSKSVYFYLGVKDPILNSTITNTGYLKILENGLKKNESASFVVTISPKVFRTGIFPLYLWLGEDLTNRDYLFDLIDGIYSLNIVSILDSKELGYNSASPNGYFNLNFNLKSL